jgi:branched-chain amino acid transport system ATP-binding protein
MLEVQDLVAGYGAMPVLRGVSLSVGPGEIVAVLGANGVGKTTLNRAVSGLIRPNRGSIRFEGEAIERLDAAGIVARGLIHVPEGRKIFPNMTVRENLDLGGQHLDDAARARQLAWLFELFPILKERQGQMAQTLSGGEQQMLAIGRALMMQPQILILDEPTLGLAPVILELLSKALEKLRQTTKITVLLGEQNVTFALPHADRVYVLEHARIVWEGDPGRFAAEAGKDFL